MDNKKDLIYLAILSVFLVLFVGKFFGSLLKDLLDLITQSPRRNKNKPPIDVLIERQKGLLRQGRGQGQGQNSPAKRENAKSANSLVKIRDLYTTHLNRLSQGSQGYKEYQKVLKYLGH